MISPKITKTYKLWTSILLVWTSKNLEKLVQWMIKIFPLITSLCLCFHVSLLLSRCSTEDSCDELVMSSSSDYKRDRRVFSGPYENQRWMDFDMPGRHFDDTSCVVTVENGIAVYLCFQVIQSTCVSPQTVVIMNGVIASQ